VGEGEISVNVREVVTGQQLAHIGLTPSCRVETYPDPLGSGHTGAQADTGGHTRHQELVCGA